MGYFLLFATMSRLFVKNLPKYITDERLKNHFSQKGEVTDVRIIKNKNTGESRQFGFVGYRTEKEAKEAIKFFNNSYLDTRKIDVSLAKASGDNALPTPWSRHSKGSNAYKRAHPEDGKDENEEPAKKKQKTDNDEKGQKKYFMNLVKSSKGQLWRDDNLVPEAKKVKVKSLDDGTKMKIVESYVPSKKTGGEGVFYEKKKIVFADSDDEMSSDDEYQSIPNTLEQDEKEDEEMDTIINDDNVSDMDYLRSKMVSKPIIEKEIDVEEDIEESSSDEEEKDE